MKKLITLTLVVALVAFLSVSFVKAADANAPKAPKAESVTIKGKIMVTKDAEGKITAVKLHSMLKGMYSITLDAMGKELGEKMDGKTVEATGVETAKDTEKWLTVEKYSEVQKPAEKPKEPAEKPKQ
jgi:hypothetical protein